MNCSVHILMSLYDCIQKQGYEWKINTNYEYDGLLEALCELSSICGGGVFVNISNHPEFHQSTGNLMLTATKVMEMRTNAGVVVTDNDLMWKQVSGLTDSNYSCAGDSKLFYVLQKRLIVKMIMDVLALDAQTVSDLEDACVGVSPLQFNVPQGATGGNVRYHYKPDFTAHFTLRRNIMKNNEGRAKRSVRRTATTCERSGVTSKMLWNHFAHNVMQREPNPQPTISTTRTHASTATRTG